MMATATITTMMMTMIMMTRTTTMMMMMSETIFIFIFFLFQNLVNFLMDDDEDDDRKDFYFLNVSKLEEFFKTTGKWELSFSHMHSTYKVGVSLNCTRGFLFFLNGLLPVCFLLFQKSEANIFAFPVRRKG